jgi:hypothetical protein
LIVFATEHLESYLVSLRISRFHQPVGSRRLVLGSEMGVPHDHLEHPVPEQFCNRPQIYSSHYESTCKGMAVAMPGVPLDLRFF